MAITTMAGLIRTHGTERADHRVIRCAGHDDISYGQLYERAQRVANGLRSEGVTAQDHVAILDKNAPEYFDLLFGAALINAIHTPVNWRLAPPEVAYVVNDAQAKVLVVGADFLPVLDAIAEQLSTVTTILVVGGESSHESFDAWRDRQPSGDPGVEASVDDVAFQLYSSGTTGMPKGVMLTNSNLFSALDFYGDVLEVDEDSVNLIAMPLFHIGGGGWAVGGMYYGCSMVLVREVDPMRIADLIPSEGITHGFLVPAVFQFMLLIPGIAERDYSKLKCFLYGASPISTEVLKGSLAAFKCKFMQAYGLTETTGTVVALYPEDHDPSGANAHRLRAAGRPIPGVELRIVDAATGEDVPLGEVGEILIRSVQVMKGYWNLPEETAKSVLAEGWFRTGDAAYMDQDGYVYIHDRVKDMIVSGGENVYPAEVENVLMSHPAIADCAVIGVPSDRWGETPKAMVVLKPDAQLSEDELIAYCRERLAKYKCPTSMDVITAIPRNPTGKILKKDLRAPFWVGRTRLVN